METILLPRNCHPNFPPIRLVLILNDTRLDPRAGGLLLDQPGPTVVRVVRQFAVAAGNRTGRTGRRHGTVPGDAHVHHVGAAEDRHESRRAATGAGPVARKGERSNRLSPPTPRFSRRPLLYPEPFPPPIRFDRLKFHPVSSPYRLLHVECASV